MCCGLSVGNLASFHFCRPCNAAPDSLYDWGYYWLTLVVGFCVCKYLVGLLLSCFGHARENNNSETSCLTWAVFTLSFGVVTLLSSPPSQSCELLFYCGMQWLVFGLLRIGLEAGYAWENGVWGHSDRVRLLYFFCKTLEEYWKGKLGLEGMWNKERTDSWCWVCGCLRGQG